MFIEKTLPAFAPIFTLVKKDLLLAMRLKKFYFIFFIFLTFCSIMVMLTWPSNERFYSMASFSRGAFHGIAGYLFAGALLLIPAFGGGSISSEREKNTFDLLFQTQISPTGLFLGKVIHSLSFYLIFLIGLLPVISTFFFAVGLDWVEVGLTFGYILFTATTCTFISVMASALCRKFSKAINIAFGTVILFLFGPTLFLFLGCLLAGFLTKNFQYYMQILESTFPYIFPIYTLGSIFSNSISGGEYLLAILYQAALMVLSYPIALHYIKKPIKPPKGTTKKIKAKGKVSVKKETKGLGKIVGFFFGNRQINDGINPIIFKDIHYAIEGSKLSMPIMFLAIFIVYFGLGFWILYARFKGIINSSNLNGFLMAWINIQVLIPLFAAPSTVATLLAKEYELGNIDMLRLTLLKPREIILGKFYTGAIAMSPLILASLLSGIFIIIPAAFLGKLNWMVVVLGYNCLFVSLFFQLALGIFCSTITKSSKSALVLNFGIAFAVFSGLIGGIITLIASSTVLWIEPDSFFFSIVGIFYSPLIMSWMTLEEVAPFLLFTWLFNTLIYIGLGFFLIRCATKYFSSFRAMDD